MDTSAVVLDPSDKDLIQLGRDLNRQATWLNSTAKVGSRGSSMRWIHAIMIEYKILTIPNLLLIIFKVHVHMYTGCNKCNLLNKNKPKSNFCSKVIVFKL